MTDKKMDWAEEMMFSGVGEAVYLPQPKDKKAIDNDGLYKSLFPSDGKRYVVNAVTGEEFVYKGTRFKMGTNDMLRFFGVRRPDPFNCKNPATYFFSSAREFMETTGDTPSDRYMEEWTSRQKRPA
jgi:hypothetical protein